jgi:hypothetical protein
MTKSSSIWIAVLTITAVILSAILLSSDRSAQAGMLNNQSPKVTMITTGAGGADEGLLIVDRAQQKLILYLLKGNELTPVAGSSLLR